jgi:hypothetical protein
LHASLGLRQIIMHDFTDAECYIGNKMSAGQDFENRKPCNICHHVIVELKRRRSTPNPLKLDIFPVVAHQLANARLPIDIRNDFDQKIWFAEFPKHRVWSTYFMLVAHAASGAEHRAGV